MSEPSPRHCCPYCGTFYAYEDGHRCQSKALRAMIDRLRDKVEKLETDMDDLYYSRDDRSQP
jgi:hypothetical protein